MRWRRALALSVTLAVLPVAGTHLGAAPTNELPRAVRDLPGSKLPSDWEMRLALNSANRYSLTTWWAAATGGLYLGAGGRSVLTYVSEAPHAMTAYSLALSLATGAYDPSVTGVPFATAVDRTRDVVVALAGSHLSNSPVDGWGATWQSALWASLGGTAAWLLGPTLLPVEQLLVDRMVQTEADLVAARPLHYLRDRAGRVVTAGDTGAEDMSWDSTIVLLASELYPTDERRPAWLDAGYRRLVGAYARPADVGNPRPLNGRRVGDWLAGSNAERSALVVNHGRVYPDYSASIVHSLATAALFPLFGHAVPEAARFNAAETYAALSTVSHAPPRYRRPGGTAYRLGSPAIYYPEGSDWGETRQMAFAAFDAMAATLDLDRGAARDAVYWKNLHLGKVRAMQQRHANGATYEPADRDKFFLREEWVGMHAALAYSTEYVVANRLLRWHNRAPY